MLSTLPYLRCRRSSSDQKAVKLPSVRLGFHGFLRVSALKNWRNMAGRAIIGVVALLAISSLGFVSGELFCIPLRKVTKVLIGEKVV